MFSCFIYMFSISSFLFYSFFSALFSGYLPRPLLSLLFSSLISSFTLVFHFVLRFSHCQSFFITVVSFTVLSPMPFLVMVSRYVLFFCCFLFYFCQKAAIFFFMHSYPPSGWWSRKAAQKRSRNLTTMTELYIYI